MLTRIEQAIVDAVVDKILERPSPQKYGWVVSGPVVSSSGVNAKLDVLRNAVENAEKRLVEKPKAPVLFPKRRLSAKGRAAISKAAKLRWKKYHAKKGKRA